MKKSLISILKKHSSTLLSCIGTAGVIATAIAAGRDTPKALTLLERAKEDKGSELTVLETVKTAAPAYIPAAVSGAVTIACILGANALNKRQQAALTSAYILASEGYKNYQRKVKDLYGEEAHQDIVSHIAVEQTKPVEITAPGMMSASSLDFGAEEDIRTFYDSFSDRYFESTIGKVLQAEYHLNRNFMLGGCVSLNDFYKFLGLEETDYGSKVGWSTVNGDLYWIDFDHYKTTLDDGMECCIIDMVFGPTPGWDEDF